MHSRTAFAEVLRRRMVLLLGAMAVPYLCTFAVLAGVGLAVRVVMYASASPQPIAVREMWNSFGLMPKLGVILAFCLSAGSPYAVGTAGVALITWEDCQAKTPTPGQIAAGVWPLVPQLIVLGFLTGVGVLFGSLALLIPGILFAVFTAFAVPSLVIEKLSVPKALRRSIMLTKSEIFTIGGLYLLALLLTLPMRVFASLASAQSLVLALSMVLLGTLVIHVCLGVAITLLYCKGRSTLNEYTPGIVET